MDLSDGAHIVLLSEDQERPYVVIPTPRDDDVQSHYSATLTPTNLRLHDALLRRDAWLQVVYKGEFVGLRSRTAGDCFLQARRKAPHTLSFFSPLLGVWEQWQVESHPSPQGGLPVLVLTSRQLPAMRLRFKVHVAQPHQVPGQRALNTPAGLDPHESAASTITSGRGWDVWDSSDVDLLDLSRRVTLGYASRVAKFPMLLCLKLWAGAARRSQGAGRAAAARAAAARLRRAWWMWRAWAAYCRHRVMLRLHALRLDLRRVSRRLRLALLTWHAEVARARRMRRVGLILAGRRLHRLQRSALDSLIRYSWQQRSNRQLIVTCRRRRSREACEACFCALWVYSNRRRSQRHQALAHACHAVLQRAWRRWAHKAHHAHNVRHTIIAAWQPRRARAQLVAWRHAASDRSARRDSKQSASRRWQRRQARATFCHWRQAAAHSRAWRRRTSVVLRRTCLQRLSALFVGWHTAAVDGVVQLRQEEHAWRWWRRRRLMLLFRGWVHMAAVRRHRRVVSDRAWGRSQRRLLSAHLLSWCIVAAKHRSSRAAVVERCFNVWLQQARFRRLGLQASHRLALRRQRYLLASMFGGWHQASGLWCGDAPSMSMALLTNYSQLASRNSPMRDLFVRWRGVTTDGAPCRWAAAALQRRAAWHLRTRAFRHWRQAPAASDRRVQSFLSPRVHARTAAVFRGWRGAVVTRRQRVAFAAVIGNRRTAFLLAAAWSQWSACLSETRMLARQLWTAVVSRVQHMQRSVLTSWQRWSRRRRQLRDLGGLLTASARARTLHGAFGAWRAELNTLVRAAMLHRRLQASLLAAILHHWHLYAWRRVRLAVGRRRLSARVAKIHLRAILHAWLEQAFALPPPPPPRPPPHLSMSVAACVSLPGTSTTESGTQVPEEEEEDREGGAALMLARLRAESVAVSRFSRRVRHALLFWRDWCGQRRRLSRLLTVGFLRRAMERRAVTWRAWLRLVQCTRLVAEHDAQRQRRCLRRLMAGWHGVSTRRRRLREAGDRLRRLHSRQLQRGVVSSWRAWSRVSHTRGMGVGTLRTKARVASLRRSLLTMARYAARAVRRRRLVAHMDGVLYTHRMLAVMLTWRRQAAAAGHLMVQHQQLLQQRRARRVLRGWRDAAVEAGWTRVADAEAAKQLTGLSMRVFYAWLELVARSKIERSRQEHQRREGQSAMPCAASPSSHHMTRYKFLDAAAAPLSSSSADVLLAPILPWSAQLPATLPPPQISLSRPSTAPSMPREPQLQQPTSMFGTGGWRNVPAARQWPELDRGDAYSSNPTAGAIAAACASAAAARHAIASNGRVDQTAYTGREADAGGPTTQNVPQSAYHGCLSSSGVAHGRKDTAMASGTAGGTAGGTGWPPHAHSSTVAPSAASDEDPARYGALLQQLRRWDVGGMAVETPIGWASPAMDATSGPHNARAGASARSAVTDAPTNAAQAHVSRHTTAVGPPDPQLDHGPVNDRYPPAVGYAGGHHHHTHGAATARATLHQGAGMFLHRQPTTTDAAHRGVTHVTPTHTSQPQAGHQTLPATHPLEPSMSQLPDLGLRYDERADGTIACLNTGSHAANEWLAGRSTLPTPAHRAAQRSSGSSSGYLTGPAVHLTMQHDAAATTAHRLADPQGRSSMRAPPGNHAALAVQPPCTPPPPPPAATTLSLSSATAAVEAVLRVMSRKGDVGGTATEHMTAAANEGSGYSKHSVAGASEQPSAAFVSRCHASTPGGETRDSSPDRRHHDSGDPDVKPPARRRRHATLDDAAITRLEEVSRAQHANHQQRAASSSHQHLAPVTGHQQRHRQQQHGGRGGRPGGDLPAGDHAFHAVDSGPLPALDPAGGGVPLVHLGYDKLLRECLELEGTVCARDLSGSSDPTAAPPRRPYPSSSYHAHHSPVVASTTAAHIRGGAGGADYDVLQSATMIRVTPGSMVALMPVSNWLGGGAGEGVRVSLADSHRGPTGAASVPRTRVVVEHGGEGARYRRQAGGGRGDGEAEEFCSPVSDSLALGLYAEGKLLRHEMLQVVDVGT